MLTAQRPPRSEPIEPYKLGTTILGFRFKDGIILCADSRSTAGGRVANRCSRKITRITDKIYLCRSGSAADTQFLSKELASHLAEHRLQIQQDPSVATAAQILSLYNHSYRDALLAGFVLGGFDATGPHVYNILPGGSAIEAEYALSGSGSTYILGLFDTLFKSNMSKEEAIQFGYTAIRAAAARDNYSGGVMRYVVIEASGCTAEGHRELD